MSLFMCMQCGCVENTALCNYWDQHLSKKPVLCSACDPDIGKWHAQFAQRSAVGMLVDQNGYLWSKGGRVPAHYQIMGEVLPLHKVRPTGVSP